MPLENNYPYAPDFRPILQVGQTARLIRGTPTNFIDVEVVGVFPLPVHRHDFGTAAGNLVNGDCTHLDMPVGEMAQYRYVPRGKFRVTLQHPVGVDVYRTVASRSNLPLEDFVVLSGADDLYELSDIRRSIWAMSEFMVFEAETPRFDVWNFEPLAQTEAHVDFYGIGFALKKATKVPPVSIWVNGRPHGEKLID